MPLIFKAKGTRRTIQQLANALWCQLDERGCLWAFGGKKFLDRPQWETEEQYVSIPEGEEFQPYTDRAYSTEWLEPIQPKPTVH